MEKSTLRERINKWQYVADNYILFYDNRNQCDSQIMTN